MLLTGKAGRSEAVVESSNSHPAFLGCEFATDRNHARDRMRLLLEAFKKRDAAKARSSGEE